MRFVLQRCGSRTWRSCFVVAFGVGHCYVLNAVTPSVSEETDDKRIASTDIRSNSCGAASGIPSDGV